jgi:tripartite-type tricarboxylate transporter receptor subunit TctC
MMTRAVLLAVLASLALYWPGHASAQTYPNKQPIKIVIPFPAGGPTDGMARLISERFGTMLGQTIIIENRGGGAGGSNGAKLVAAADPDGYTILMTPGGPLTTGPAVHSNIGYDPVKVFEPVCQIMETPLIFAVHPDLPVKTLAEIVAYAKANPGKISWGTQGFGTGPHLLLELFRQETGANITHVPYRGTAPLLTGVLAGEVQMVVDVTTTSLAHIEAGKLRAIAIAGDVRHPKLPGVQTVVEAGLPSLQFPFWLGVLAPAGTPSEVIAKLNDSFRQALATPSVRTRLEALGADAKIGTPDNFKAMLAAEFAKWSAVAKAANIKVE